MRSLRICSSLILLAACGGSGNDGTPDASNATDATGAPDAPGTPGTPGPPVENRPPNGVGQEPAFEGQTRAPGMTVGVDFEVKTVADGLEQPWAIELFEDGRMLVTERPGRLRVVTPDGALSEPVTGLPEVDARDQGGLLDVAIAPDFSSSQTIYWSYAEPREGGTGTALAKGRLVTDGGAPRVEDVQVIFQQQPTMDSTLHYGSRIAFAPDGTLFLTLGERSILEGRVQSQDLGSHLGKVIRIHADGSVPADNPFVDREGALPEIWSYGHRNMQGATIHPDTGALWVVDHGARGGDELNTPAAGKNYGWPIITYGIEYSGEPIGEGITQKEGMEQPVYYWDPVIAPSGMLFYTGDVFPAWRGSLFIGSLGGEHLDRLTLDGERVVGEERLLTDLQQRIRDVVQGPDGAIYVVTGEGAGRILKLVAP
jgi:glucose/arabinose dehydrogenase